MKNAIDPPDRIKKDARKNLWIKDLAQYESWMRESLENRDAFWGEQAKSLHWFKPWKNVCDDSNKPFYKWFTGGSFNVAYNALDRHLESGRADKAALIWENEKGQERRYTYKELTEAVSRFSNLLKSLGVKKGEIVTLYLPFIPELPIAMLACARIGAIHNVVYGGFSSEALATRASDAQSKVLITADGGWRRGKVVDLKGISNEAMERAPSIKTCITVRHTRHDVRMKAGRDEWLHEALEKRGVGATCECERTDAEDPLFILYTSGSTGKPKALLHTHAGYGLYTSFTHKLVFDIHDSDVYWCTADPGWITGHSYVVYGPLINGTTVFLHEGAPDFPQPDRWWEMIEKHKVTVFYTSPTAIRGLMRYGDEWPRKRDLSSLLILGSVGEPINPEAWRWFHERIGRGQCPIMDTWWQTETGGFAITPLPITPLKPGSATKPFFGHRAAVVDDQGTPVPPGAEGSLVLQTPWPGMARTIWGDDARFRETYWKAFEKQGWYKTGDSARMDEDGYIWVIGRLDDVIKVSGYRLGTAEIESALVSHPAVAEAAAIGLPHALKGNAIHVFVTLKQGEKESQALLDELKARVAHQLGPIARPEEIRVSDTLPKTRSGKILRRVLRARAQGLDEGDVSTLEE